MSEFLISTDDYQDGLNWEEYLLAASNSRSMLEKRLNSDPDEQTLEFFRYLDYEARVLILAEPFCGDCAWTLPSIVRLVSEAPKLTFKIFLKNEYPELMDKLLTKGKMAIPKIAILDKSGNILATWGPRPAKIQKYVEESVGKIEIKEWKTRVMKYYREEGIKDLYQEFIEIFEKLEIEQGKCCPF